MKMYKMTGLVLICSMFFISGCTDTVKDVPPNYLGMKLTPTGYEGKIYTTGQVDIGTKDFDGRWTKLVLIQRSAVTIKEAFAKKKDEDHRCTTADQKPVSIDVRFLLALPDRTTPEGEKAVKRILTLGNPIEEKGEARVLKMSSRLIYKEQAMMVVRGKIRSICAGYSDYDTLFKAFADESLNTKINAKIISVFSKQRIPFVVADTQVSNIKPDEAVWKAKVQVSTVDDQIKAIKKMGEFLDKNPKYWPIFKFVALKDIAKTGSKQGNTILYMTDISDTNGRQVVLLPKSRK